LNLTFRNIKHILHLLLDSEKGCPASSLRLFNYPFIVRNVIIAQNILDMNSMSVHGRFSNICRSIQDNFPVTLQEFYDSEVSFEKYVTREIISLYYLFLIIEELGNLPSSLSTTAEKRYRGRINRQHCLKTVSSRHQYLLWISVEPNYCVILKRIETRSHKFNMKLNSSSHRIGVSWGRQSFSY